MTAFLYLPTSYDARLPRRIDLANIGSLFAESEEPAREARLTVHLRRTAVALLLLLFALGDIMMVSRPGALSACLFRAQPTLSAPTT